MIVYCTKCDFKKHIEEELPLERATQAIHTASVDHAFSHMTTECHFDFLRIASESKQMSVPERE